MDKKPKVVRDRQGFCGQVYSFNPLLYPDMPSKSKRESFSAVILVKVNHKLKTVMLDSLNIFMNS